MNYPEGVGDWFEYSVRDTQGKREPWKSIEIKGSWFPEAFIGTMSSVQRHACGDDSSMSADVEDVIRTMACVEAAYEASRRGGISPDSFLTQILQ